MQVISGFAERDRARVAQLYWAAFGDKLGPVLRPETRALDMITELLNPAHAISAYDGAQILGVLGFKTYDGALVGGDLGDLRRHYGAWGGIWRGALLALLESDVENQRFLIDGVFVAAAARGRGVGSALLQAAETQARLRGYAQMRLDVIDRNTRARALYERHGYRAIARQRTGALRWVFGFAASDVMVKQLDRLP